MILRKPGRKRCFAMVFVFLCVYLLYSASETAVVRKRVGQAAPSSHIIVNTPHQAAKERNTTLRAPVERRRSKIKTVMDDSVLFETILGSWSPERKDPSFVCSHGRCNDSRRLEAFVEHFERYQYDKIRENNTNSTAQKLDLLTVPINSLTDQINFTYSLFRASRGKPSFLPSSILKNVPSLCKLEDGQPPYLLILIPSINQNQQTRDTIRSTWANVAYNGGFWAHQRINKTVKVLFVLGGEGYTKKDQENVTKEALQHNDVIVIDFLDSYRNLSIKIGGALQWVTKYCEGVSYVVKVDEDTFVYIPQLLNVIEAARSLTDKFVMGHPHVRSQPRVVRWGKWQVGQEYPLPLYPRYVYGHSYVISGPAIGPILDAYKKLPLIRNEDALFTGILAKLSGVSRFSHTRFARGDRREIICDIVGGRYVSVTSCCDEHHHKLYTDLLNDRCDGNLLRHFPAPGCRYYANYTQNAKKIRGILSRRLSNPSKHFRE